MNVSDLKIGMYITNTGSIPINVYDSTEATAQVFLTIASGAVIGQIVDFANSANGYMILFTSDEIKGKASFLKQATAYLLSWLPGEYVGGGVLWNDLANIPDLATQVQQQSVAMQTAYSNGASIMNSTKKELQNAGDSLFDAIPWKIVLVAAGGYVFLNWNTYFKSAKTR